MLKCRSTSISGHVLLLHLYRLLISEASCGTFMMALPYEEKVTSNIACWYLCQSVMAAASFYGNVKFNLTIWSEEE
jgi:hypothetical protein